MAEGERDGEKGEKEEKGEEEEKGEKGKKGERWRTRERGVYAGHGRKGTDTNTSVEYHVVPYTSVEGQSLYLYLGKVEEACTFLYCTPR